MPAATAKTLFITSCLLCLIAIATGAVLEVLRQKRGESLLRPGQLRLRVFSALVWMLALGSLAYAVAFLWPQKGDVIQARKFLSVISGATMLLFIGVLLLGYDVWQVLKARRIKEAEFNLQLLDMAREEIEKAKTGQNSSPTSKADGVP